MQLTKWNVPISSCIEAGRPAGRLLGAVAVIIIIITIIRLHLFQPYQTDQMLGHHKMGQLLERRPCLLEVNFEVWQVARKVSLVYEMHLQKQTWSLFT